MITISGNFYGHANSLAPSTNHVYTTAWRRFGNFCSFYNIQRVSHRFTYVLARDSISSNNQHLSGSSFWNIQISVCLPSRMNADTNVYLLEYLYINFYYTTLHIRFCVSSDSNLYDICVRCIAVTESK